MSDDKIKKYGGNLHENLVQSRHWDWTNADDIIGDEVVVSEEDIEYQYQVAWGARDIAYRGACDIALEQDITEFERWQQTPDEDETFAAIHVALLLSKENRIILPEPA